MAIVTIIGIGQMGSALAFVAAENGNEVRMVGTPVDRKVVDACRKDGRHPKLETSYPAGLQFFYCEQWQEAVLGADFVIGAISSYGVAWFLKDILGKMDPSIPVLSAAKGLMDQPDGSLISYPGYWEQELRKIGIERDVCALGGPGTADGIIHRDPTQVVLCGKDAAILEKMKNALQTPWFQISLTRDANGLESAVAIKNAYALGISIALGFATRKNPDANHYNSQAAVFYQAAKEMIHILKLQQADMDSTLIGLGDLYVTSTGARTRKLGLLLGEGKTVEEAQQILGTMTLESLVIVRRLRGALAVQVKNGLVKAEDFPLLQFVTDVLDGKPVEDLPWERFTFRNL